MPAATNMFTYQKTNRYFAQLPTGLEALAVQELTALGARQVKQGFRGVHFSADQGALYGINYQARLITRVLAPLVSFPCRDRDELYRAGRSIDWQAIFSVDNTFAVFANISGNNNIVHSNYAALCLKDAVVDHFSSRSGKRPNVDKRMPHVWINLHILKNKASINLCTSGGSLHRRGYRQETGVAPMQETLAAAMVSLSGWNGERPLYDPLCGTGTLLCEAAMKACRIPAGFFRKKFGFYYLPDFNKPLWDKVKRDADTNIRALGKGLVAGGDISKQAVNAARTNCRLLPEGRMIRIVHKDFQKIVSLENMVILCNPPYGLRMQTEEDLASFYKALGDFLKQRCKGSEAYIYFGNREMIKKIGLKTTWKKPMKNAGLDGRVVKYELY